jgi:hypothetical protein
VSRHPFYVDPDMIYFDAHSAPDTHPHQNHAVPQADPTHVGKSESLM